MNNLKKSLITETRPADVVKAGFALLDAIKKCPDLALPDDVAKSLNLGLVFRAEDAEAVEALAEDLRKKVDLAPLRVLKCAEDFLAARAEVYVDVVALAALEELVSGLVRPVDKSSDGGDAPEQDPDASDPAEE
ncbi:hypothetical protein [Cereibacter johrii]|uniref:hypothetical protein n=1 Tax=Cereibacter johrii TaxID=445629 RepID=UPI000DCF4ADD|nr:hypothetical protein [Cereibacter johrii]RAZ83438.1 hypothetical protein DDV93_14100 [Cereibacter johrii]